MINYTELNKNSGHFYGLDSQLGQTQEEAAELIQAISKYKRANGQGQPIGKDEGPIFYRRNLVEEIVDVSIMLEQLMDLLPVKKDEFFHIYKMKVKRTCARRGILVEDPEDTEVENLAKKINTELDKMLRK